MIWSEGIKQLCYSTTTMIKQGNIHLDYTAVNYLNEFDTQLLPDILYFAEFEQWKKFRQEDGLSFVLYGEFPAALEDFMPNQSVNILLFQDKRDFSAFYAILQAELSCEHRMNGELQKLFMMVSENAGLQKIVDKVAEIFHRPVTILDNAYSFIACSQNYIFPESIMSEAVKNGYLPAVIRDYLKKISIPNPKHKIRDAFLLNLDFIKINNKRLTNYFTYIYMNNINICSYSVLELDDNPIPENEQRYLPEIASILSAELQKKSFYMLNKASYYTHLLSTLLGDQPADRHDIDERIKQFDYNLGRYKYIICVEYWNVYVPGPEIQLLADRLHYCFKNSFYMIAEDSIIYFVSRSEGDRLSQKEIDDWSRILEIRSGNIKIGISSEFEHLDNVKLFYQNAKEAVTVGSHHDPNKKIYLYDDYRIANVIELLAPHTDLTALCYPALIHLVAYDEAKGTNLSYTLYKYLENPKNPAQVCEELFIHKNTLYYRLNKISSIMGSTFESANEIAQINLTFEILKYQRRFNVLIIS